MPRSEPDTLRRRKRLRDTLLAAADWIVPPAVFRSLTYYRPAELAFRIRNGAVLASNATLRNRHAGERCFILANGPSVNQQNIRPLAHETVISVSKGYHHPDFRTVRPRYHCVPQITYGNMTPEMTVAWFREMDAALPPETELFLASQEYELVQQNRLFPERTVRYLCPGQRYFAKKPAAIPDLTGLVPRAESVPVMALIIALYMGLARSYLLGVEHDWFVSKRYDYFFDRSAVPWKDAGVNSDGTMDNKLLNDLPHVHRLWTQYAALDALARANNAEIFNATAGGMLDVFPRVRFEDIVSQSDARSRAARG